MDNSQANTLAKATVIGKDPPLGTFLETLHQPTTKTLDGMTTTILHIETIDWRAPLLSFLSGTKELEDPIAFHCI